MSRSERSADEVAALVAAVRTALDGGAPLVIGEAPARPVPSGTAFALRTSGSTTGAGRPVALPTAAVLASVDATHARLGGPGRWVLALPPTHVAGVQVLARAARAGTDPIVAVVDGRFDTARLATALDAAPDDLPLYLSLVPTQLHRVLEAPGGAVDALTRCRAVLVGGAAPPAGLVERARAAGVPVVVTYGMTETCGGCVYDGVPLDGVRVALDDDGRVQLGGPVVADGYLDDGPQPFRVDVDGVRWFETADLGSIVDGRLDVLGRADDVIVTGGVNVHPLLTERLLDRLAPGAVVVGVPDAEWGSLVTAVVSHAVTLAELRAAAGGGPQAPRAVVRVDEIPTRGPGKPDRLAVAALAAAALAHGEGQRV